MAQALHAKVDHTLQAVDSFSALLETETNALRKSDFPLFESLQDQKLELAQSYQDAILAFEEDIDVLKNLDGALKQKLHAAHARFTAAADANQQIIVTTKNVSERVVKLIMTAAKRSVADAPTYSAYGTQGLSEKIPVHFKLNEVL